jgi:hypothetical protein
MGKHALIPLAASIVALLFVACGSVDRPDPTPTLPPEPPLPANVEIFIAGSEGKTDACMQGAMVWHDGELTRVSSKDSQLASANSIFVDGDDVYVAGYRINSEYTFSNLWPLLEAALWVNGKETILDTPFGCTSYAHSVCVSDGDVYVAGYYERYWIDYPVAVVWKNGVRTELTDPLLVVDDDNNLVWGIDSKAFSVAVSNGNVYVAGLTLLYEGGMIPPSFTVTVWKNGEILYAVGACGYPPFKLFVKGDDVYVASMDDDPRNQYPGWYGSVPTVWKNGVATHLGPGNTMNSLHARFYTTPSSVFVDDDDNVYVTARMEIFKEEYLEDVHRSIYWKNGEEIILDEIAWGGEEPFYIFESNSAKSVYVLNGDVYVVGYVRSGTAGPYFRAALWVNGEAHRLPINSPYSVASCIFVREKVK